MIGVHHVDVNAAYDGDYVSADEAVTVFDDRRDTERGRRFDDKAGAVEESPALVRPAAQVRAAA